jgi:hypothetical protein
MEDVGPIEGERGNRGESIKGEMGGCSEGLGDSVKLLRLLPVPLDRAPLLELVAKLC